VCQKQLAITSTYDKRLQQIFADVTKKTEQQNVCLFSNLTKLMLLGTGKTASICWLMTHCSVTAPVDIFADQHTAAVVNVL